MYKALKTKLYPTKNDLILLRFLMHASKNLYNEALYNVRQHYFETKEYLGYIDNYKLLSKNSENYRVLNTQQAQTVIQKVDEAMKAFFGSIKSKKAKKVRLPRYLDKDGFYPLFDRMVYKPSKEVYTLPRSNFVKRLSKMYESNAKQLENLKVNLDSVKSLSLAINTPKCIQNKTIKEITIKPKYDGNYMEVVYVYIDDEIIESKNTKTNTMGIDFGYNNLAYCAVTNGNHLHIDGLRLKSMNQRYHKQISRFASIRPNQNILTKRMIKIIEKRNNQMTYGINKASKLIIEHALANNIKQIIMGYNDGFKDINTSKENNQWFNTIPIARLRDRICYLSKLNNIETKIVNESHTSKASFIDSDSLTYTKEKPSFSGKRTKRGLYVSKSGKMINADLNAALNIIRKSNPDVSKKLGSIGLNTPKRTYLFTS